MSKSIKKRILLVLVLLTTLAGISLIQYLVKQESSPQITVKDLREQSYQFISDTFLKDYIETGNLHALANCKQDNTCNFSLEAKLPTYSWTLLPLARGLKQKETTQQEIKYEAIDEKSLLKKILDYWMIHADLNTEHFSLHQLYEVANLLENEDFSYWVKDRDQYLSDLFKVNFVDNNTDYITNSYLLATTARQVVMASILKLKSELNNENIITTAESRISLALDLLERTKADQKDGIDSNKEPLFFGEKEEWPQTACYIPWAQVKILEASLLTGESKIDLSKHLLNEIKDFFYRFKEKSTNQEANFEALQSVLPCLHSIVDFNSILSNSPYKLENLDVSPEQKLNLKNDLSEIYKNILQKVIIEARQRKCGRPGAYIFNLEISKIEPLYANRCDENIAVVDLAWLIFTLDPAFDNLKLSDL